jgi:hypothetical protein
MMTDTPTERGFRTLGSALAEVTAGAQYNVEQVLAYAQDVVAPFDLFSAGPTTHSEAMIAKVERALAEHAEAGRKPPKDLLADQRTWTQKLRVARERDRLQAERTALDPACICLGFGGRYPREGLTIVTQDGRPLADPDVTVFRDPCPCDLGQAASLRVEAARQQLLADDRQRRVSRLWRDLRMPEIPDDVSLDSHPDQVKVSLCRRWYRGEFKPGLVIAGYNQRGKSVTAFLLARQAVDDGQGVIAMTVPDLLGRLRETFDHDKRLLADPEQPRQNSHQQLIESLQTVPFLVLDDLGAETMSDYVEQALYQILDGRAAGRRATIITTNLPKEPLAERVGPRDFARVANLCDRVVFDGPVVGPARGGLDDLEDLVGTP